MYINTYTYSHTHIPLGPEFFQLRPELLAAGMKCLVWQRGSAGSHPYQDHLLSLSRLILTGSGFFEEREVTSEMEPKAEVIL